ncbi:PI-PLC X domain-containing protein 2 [Eupeodes corollae]|uniref:PI-PLC X domain-containing protein 2 n=1 Tax=Eupeodes corollae TaxID=290404 RepID=UPI002492AABA|nr:PI-PLC X domain-containing protein 2 [Eupeodes corollae]
MSNENWMGQLSENARSLSIINIAIPGSHNSMTYGINSKSKPAPDAEQSTRRLNYIFPWFVRRWAITQSADVLQQLKLGVRFFDLRICQNEEKFYYCHGLYSMTIIDPLLEIINFLESHPKEFVILDFQHFYAMQPQHHIRLHNYLKQMFGSRLYTRNDGPLSKCTLNYCHPNGKQVIIIYRRFVNLPQDFWPSLSWPTPWPNVCSVKKLEEYLDTALLTRQPMNGYVSQCIFTPTVRYITLRFLSSLRSSAKKVDKELCSWIKSQQPGPFNKNKPTVNVFLGDFVNLKDGQFCQWVIDLNSCLECDT